MRRRYVRVPSHRRERATLAESYPSQGKLGSTDSGAESVDLAAEVSPSHTFKMARGGFICSGKTIKMHYSDQTRAPGSSDGFLRWQSGSGTGRDLGMRRRFGG